MRMQGQYYQYQQGFLDRASVEGMLRNLAETYPSWIQLGLEQRIEIPELRAEIESHLARHPDRTDMARPEGFEPPAPASGGQCSIH